MSLTALSDRSFRSRLGFAYIVDAYMNFDGAVRPGSTLERLYQNVTSDKQHSYSWMWETIDKYYNDFWFGDVLASELSESEFLRAINASLSQGAAYEGKTVSGAEVMAKAAAWSKRGWFRYEEKRQEKVNGAKKVGLFTGLLLSGFIL